MSRLDRTLKDGEQLLWSGKAESYQLLDLTNKPVLLCRSILCAVICLVIEALYIVTAIALEAEIKWGIIAVLFAACAASPILFVTRSMKLRDYIYAATDKRLLIIADQNKEIDYPRIHKCAFKKDADGHTSLLCGAKAVESRPGKWREIAFFGNPGDDGVSPCETFAFYAIDRPEELRKALEGRVSFEDYTLS